MTGTNAIRAEISGSDTASACGLPVRAAAPVLALCRALLAAGFDAATPLVAARGPMLCLRVRSIGEAARLEINSAGTGLTAYRPRSRPRRSRS